MTEKIYHKSRLDVTAFYGGITRGPMLHIIGEAELSKQDVIELLESLNKWLEKLGLDASKGRSVDS